MIKEVLKKAGFQDKEIEVYLALLGLGSSLVSDIAKKSGVNRSTAYVIINSLAKRGLVSSTERRGVRLYTAASPDNLVKYLEGMTKRYSELAQSVKKFLPELKSKSAPTGQKPKVRIFEGAEGMKTVYEDALSSLDTIRSYAFKKSIESVLPAEYYNRLTQKKIKIKALFPETSEAREFTTHGKDAGGKIYDFSPDISVYDNKIVFTSPEEGFGLIIESKELAGALKKAFDLSWVEAKKLGRKPMLGTAAA